MSKIGKTFTIDLDVYMWLGEYAKKHKQKESYVLNSLLRKAKKQFTAWACPECNATNDNQFNSCHECDYKRVVE